MKRNICIVTGTRSEYGLLRPIINLVSQDSALSLQLVVTGMHLSPEFGLTYRQIEDDGYSISEKIEILLSSDSHIGVSKSIGLAVISFAECFERLKPDMLIILGDRYEIFAAASAASVAKVPIVHLHGGETTEGAFDEAFRHSVTKMSYLHFTSTEEYRKRVIQLGEDPNRVFNVGAMGVENIKNLKLLDKNELENSIGFQLERSFALVTFHPVTLENNTAEQQFRNLLKALNHFKKLKVIFTKANSDTYGRIINQMIDEYVTDNRQNAISFNSMGIIKYLSAMRYCDMVVGNSSSGIIEAPSFRIPTINIGDRQKGRVKAKSIINCSTETEDIIKAIHYSQSEEFNKTLSDSINPYEGFRTSKKILDILKDFLNSEINLKKKFYDLHMY